MDNSDWVSAKFGKALDFDGSNEYFSVPKNDFSPSSLSMEAWIRGDNYAAASHNMVVSKEDQYYISIYQKKAFFKYVTPGFNERTISGITTLLTNTWYHIAATFDSNTGVRNIYVNGVLENSITNSGDSIRGDQGNPLTIGFGGTLHPFDGIIDEVRILNYAKTGFGGGVVINKVKFDVQIITISNSTIMPGRL